MYNAVGYFSCQESPNTSPSTPCFYHNIPTGDNWEPSTKNAFSKIGENTIKKIAFNLRHSD
jgi:hypothetical protein